MANGNDQFGLPLTVPIDSLMDSLRFQESGHNPNPRLRGQSGEIGAYQIMPATGRQFGMTPEALENPEVNKWVARQLMTHLLKRYHGNVPLALAAYNAGPGNVDRGRIPASTHRYVTSIMSRLDGGQPSIMSRVGGAVSGVLGASPAYADEPPGLGAGAAPSAEPTPVDPAAGRFRYSRKLGKFGMVGADGNVTPVPTDLVPETVRAELLAKYGGTAPAVPTPTATRTPTPPPRVPAPVSTTPPTLEQRYERLYGHLPSAAQYIAPGTIGEAAGTATGLGALALAPETAGLSVLAPIGAAAAGGYLEPSDQPWLSSERAERAGIEAGKETLGLIGGKFIGEVPEMAARYLGKGGMLAESAQRIGQGVARLFNRYPLAEEPTTIDKLTEDVASGVLKDKAGDRLGAFRNMLKKQIPASKKFILPDVDSRSEAIVYPPGGMDIGQAIDHLKVLNASGYGPSGDKSAKLSWAYRQAGHDARAIMKSELNRLGRAPSGERWGDMLEKLSADYGTAVKLEDIFKGARRSSWIAGERRGVIDQPTLMKRVDQEISDLGRLQGSKKALQFQRAVAPTLAGAQAEAGAGEPRGGLWHSLVRLVGRPYAPETRKMLPLPARALSSRVAQRGVYAPFASRLLGELGGDVPEEEGP